MAKRTHHPKADAGRSCGTCTACCTVLGIAELSKPVGEPCSLLKKEGHGCGSYADRPPSCREWSCLWLRGVLQPADRPDRVGVVLDMTTDGKHLVAREAFPGGLAKAEALIGELVRKGVCVFTIACDGARHVLGPPHLRAAMQELIARHSLPVVS